MILKDVWFILRLLLSIGWYMLPIEVGIYFAVQYESVLIALIVLPVVSIWINSLGLLIPLLITPKVGLWLGWNVLSWERMFRFLELNNAQGIETNS